MTSYERQVAVTVGLLTVAMAATVAFSLWTGSRYIREIGPLVQANNRILLEVTTAHLWFEEILSGDTTHDFQNVQAHLNTAETLATTMLEGGSVEGIEIGSLKKAGLIEAVGGLSDRLGELHRLADNRFNAGKTGGSGSPLDVGFDAAFASVTTHSREIDELLEEEARHKARGFFHVQLFLGFLILASSTLVTIVLFRHDRRRQTNLLKIEQGAEDLRESRERLDLALHGAELGLWDWDIAADTIIVNDRWAEMLGHDPGEFDHDLQFWADNLVHPDDLDRVRETLQRHLKGETETYETEHRLRTKSGHWIWVLDKGRVVERDASGRAIRAAGTHLDITERRRVEERRRFTDQKLALHVQQTPLAVIEWDTDFLVTAWNPAAERIFGYSEAQALGRHASGLIVPESARDHVNAVWTALLEKRGGERSTNENTTSDGRTVLCEWYNTPLIDRAGAVIAVASLVQNITERRLAEEERKKTEARMQHAQKLESLGVLAGGIAHDFNNILTGILGYADLALHDLPNGATARSSVLEVITAARHAAALSQQMLAYSGKGKFIVEPIALGALINEMRNLIEVSVSKKSLLRYHLADTLPMIKGDVSQVRQVIMNLVVNASEALGETSGVISITTGATECDRAQLAECYLHENQAEGLYVFLDVADTGCGMDEKTMSRVFDPFFTTKFAGRGLGMAAVLGIVRGHRGAIRTTSRLGRGSVFTVLFPTSKEENHPPPPEPDEPNGVWYGKGTILVVDDDETVATLAKKMLQRLGFDVMCANDGRQAVEVFRLNAAEIDCVLLDLTMPEMDGEEAYHEIRLIRKDTPVILSSGYNEQDVVQRFAGQGLAGFVQKPYQINNLSVALRRVFEK